MSELPAPLITASLVLYRTKIADYQRAIRSYLNTPGVGTLVVVDNSPHATEDESIRAPGVKYIHSPSNVGFGAAHNAGFRALEEPGRFHLILNPDTAFEPTVLPYLIDLMELNEEFAAAMPQVRFRDGVHQRLCKLLPTPMDLLLRRFLPIRSLQNRTNQRYELHELPQDRVTAVPSLSGCFLVVRSNHFSRIGGFDERYFLYMEDVDLVRRIAEYGKTVYVPHVEIVHGYAKGSYKSLRLLALHLTSAVKYFCKWGWIVDRTRSCRNDLILEILRENRRHPQSDHL